MAGSSAISDSKAAISDSKTAISDSKTCSRRLSLQSFRQILNPVKGRTSACRESERTHGDRLSTHCARLATAQGSSWGRVRSSRRYSEMAMHVEPGDLTLAHVLEDKVLLSRFAAFLESEHSVENLCFHESASAFLEANGSTHAGPGGPAGSVGTAVELVRHFVKQGAAEEVNLPAALREALVGAGRSSDPEELVKQMRAARREVFKLMEKDSFSRFVLTLSGDADDSPRGPAPGPAPCPAPSMTEGMPRMMGGFGENIAITSEGTGISDIMREYIRVSRIVRASGAHRGSVDL